MFAVQDLYWQEIHKLRDSGTTRVCKVGGGKHTLCDGINLGSFLQVLPGLYDPRDIQGPVKIAVSVLVGAGSKMLDGTASILYRFGDHRSCSVGPRLVAAAKQLSDAVEGLELNK